MSFGNTDGCSGHELVSVIIPSFNRSEFIQDALESVFSQSYENVETLVVEDGSSDDSYETLKAYEEKGLIRLLTHEGMLNRGQSASINLGLAHAKGKYIAILDSDDMFAGEKLLDQVSFLRKHPDIGMVYGQGYAVDARGDFLYKIPKDGHEEPGDPNRLLLDCYMALPGGSLVRKSTIHKVGLFEESFRAGQDHDMALRIMEATRVGYLPKLAFYYRKHGDSISAKGLERRWKTGMEILRRAAERYPYKKSTLRKRKAVLHFRLGQTYWRESCKLKAIRHVLMAGLLDPVRAVGVILRRENA